jgi:hypothetical protein
VQTHRLGPREPADLDLRDENRVFLTVPSTVNDVSAWTEFTAGVPYAARGFTLSTTADISNIFALEIAVGAAGSEVVVLGPFHLCCARYRCDTQQGFFPLHLPANTRISVRVRNLVTAGAGQALNFWMHLHPEGSHTPVGYKTATVIGYNTATHRYPTLVTQTYASDPSRHELIASTARDYLAVQALVAGDPAVGGSLVFGSQLTFWTGPAGSEFRCISRQAINAQFGATVPTPADQWLSYMPLFVPRGTRLCAGLNGGNSPNQMYATLIGYA